MTTFDAWTIRKLMTGSNLNGELGPVSGDFKDLAGRMKDQPADARYGAWQEFLAGRDDGDDLIRAVAEANPDGPPPEPGEGEDADGVWGPIRSASLPPAFPFSVDALPGPMARLAIEAADAIGCSPEFTATSALAVAAGAIGRSVSLRLKADYFASSSLFVANVGVASDGKSPGLEIAAAPVRRIDEILEADHATAVKRWEQECDALGSDGEKKLEPPPCPKPVRIDVDDITMETMPRILADNPRGAIQVCDELTGLILGMNQFKSGGKGNDRPNLLKMWSGKPIKKDRVGHEANIPIRCPHPCLTIVGGLVPDMLGSMVDSRGRADGFLDRFLFAYPDLVPIPEWTDREVTEATAAEWDGLVARLWERPLNVKEGRSVPHVLSFTAEGRSAWIGHYNDHAAEMNAPDFDPSLRGPWGKFREYAGRLTLILACASHAADPTADTQILPRVGPDTAHDAWRLVDYFKAQVRRVHAAIAFGPGAGGRASKAIEAWIREHGLPSFSEHDLKQARRWMEDAERTEALSSLARRDAIRPRPRPEPTKKGGRPPSPVFDVNPAMHTT